MKSETLRHRVQTQGVIDQLFAQPKRGVPVILRHELNDFLQVGERAVSDQDFAVSAEAEP
ncbi:MAG: hypothetical protein ABI946_01480 [Chthoniobacterales bacterium]